jgi:hypothetical protein
LSIVQAKLPLDICKRHRWQVGQKPLFGSGQRGHFGQVLINQVSEIITFGQTRAGSKRGKVFFCLFRRRGLYAVTLLL